MCSVIQRRRTATTSTRQDWTRLSPGALDLSEYIDTASIHTIGSYFMTVAFAIACLSSTFLGIE